jgi:uncharacterized protein
MPQRADTFDLETLGLRSGDGARIDAETRLDPVSLAGQAYAIRSGTVNSRVDVSRMMSGFALRLRFEAPLAGPCMRCLADAAPVVAVDAREIDQPGGGEDLRSPYLEDNLLDLASWARDALVLALPAQLLCREDCRGLCPVCGVDLNTVDPDEHRHERAADPRWAKLNELKIGEQ